MTQTKKRRVPKSTPLEPQLPQDELSFELNRESSPAQLHFYNVPPVLLPKIKEVQGRVNEYLKATYRKMVTGFEVDKSEMRHDTDQAMLFAVRSIANVIEWHTENLARIKMWREEEVSRIRQEEAALREARAQELSREALAKTTQAENLAKAFEYNSSLLWAENEGLRKALSEANEKIAQIGRANKYESVQTALGREAKKPKRAKVRGFENYE